MCICFIKYNGMPNEICKTHIFGSLDQSSMFIPNPTKLPLVFKEKVAKELVFFPLLLSFILPLLSPHSLPRILV